MTFGRAPEHPEAREELFGRAYASPLLPLFAFRIRSRPCQPKINKSRFITSALRETRARQTTALLVEESYPIERTPVGAFSIVSASRARCSSARGADRGLLQAAVSSEGVWMADRKLIFFRHLLDKLLENDEEKIAGLTKEKVKHGVSALHPKTGKRYTPFPQQLLLPLRAIAFV
ncbi:hypothetical protein MTO96_000592 [Rhipicephalus appendiculatus]